jgi:hypothetical protein
VVILKLDFAKAFDTLEHAALLKILQCKGFDERWIRMIRALLTSGSSSVLLNGVPGKKLPCKRGVRQGDPLSPVLFVEGADLLQSMVNHLAQLGQLIPPLPIPGSDFPIVQYADDTLLILQACPVQLLALKELLQSFAAGTGLKVNYSKSCLLPVNVSSELLQFLATTFGCAVGSLPFTYLGLPLGTSKPTVQDLTPIVDQIERRLNASARFLDYGGRLTLVNSVLSSLPLHFLCSLKVQKTILKIFDRSRRHCLWAKEDDSTSVNALAAWSMVCRPKRQGGLGILNMEIQNKALLLKQLHKFYSNADILWVKLIWSLYAPGALHAQVSRGSFWWRDVFSLVGDYRSISKSQIGNGSSTLFWKDFWQCEINLCDKFPRLFSYALNEDLTVADFAHSPDATSLFSLPLSVQAFEELEQVQQIMENLVIDPSTHDSRVFVWGSNQYTSAKYYKFLFARLPQDPALNSVWRSKCLPKLRVFAWLLIQDRLNTKDIMQRKNWHVEGGTTCVLCTNSILESRDHLFFQCSFAQECWGSVGIQWDNSLSISNRLLLARSMFMGPCFMEIFTCAAWNLWKERNDLIFKNQHVSMARWKVRFRSDLMLHQYRVKEAVVQPLIAWVLHSFS